LYLLTQRSLGKQAGLLCAFLFLSYPSTIVVGRKPGYEALTLFLIVLSLWCYVRYREKPSGLRLIALFGAATAGCLSDWAAYLVPPALLALQFSHHRTASPNWRLLGGLILIPATVLAAFLYTIYLVDSNSVLDLIHQGLAYTGLFSSDGAVVANIKEARIQFTLPEYLFRLVKNLDSGFGLMTLLLTSIGAILIHHDRDTRDYALVLAFAAVFTMVVFWRSLYIHLHWLQLLAAPLALTSTVAIRTLIERTDSRTRARNNPGATFMLLAILLPLAIGMLYNVRALSGQQIRGLPTPLHESSDFLRLLGHKLHALTEPGDQVMTNLGIAASTNAASYELILPYYSRRVIEKAIATPDEVSERLIVPIEDGKTRYFLLGPLTAEKGVHSPLRDWLRAKSEPKTFFINSHRFELYQVRYVHAAHSPMLLRENALDIL